MRWSDRPLVMQGDCMEIMRQLPDDCFDLTFCSPPYEDARLYLPLQFKIKGQEWVDWAVERYLECVRVTRGLVCWVVEGKTRNFQWSATPALLMADLHRRGVKLRHPAAYVRDGTPGSGGPEWLKNKWEFCVCSSKGKLPWSDNTACGWPTKYDEGGACTNRKQDGTRLGSTTAMERRQKGTHRAERDNGRKYAKPSCGLANPGNFLDFFDDGVGIKCGPGGKGHLGSRLCHENEAPFPEKLAEFFIKSFCPPSIDGAEPGSVFDPFGGSGTTAAVAYKLGRNCFTCDIRDCDQAGPTLINKRLDEVEKALDTGKAVV